jgi:alkanesulfonate monooxygenase SsuD/methylene tetrahydromethanopterin reductase-like flavin-dependent oxidoreductase (luciferase family)
VEYESLGEDFKTRGKRQEEQIDLLRRLWAEPVIDYTGKWHRVERAGLKPLPERQIPIWLGGFTEAAYHRAARLGDGFIFGGATKDGLTGLEQIRGHLAEAGRDADAFGVEAMVNYQAGPENWRSEVEAWKNAGADYVSMRGMGAGLETPQDHIDALRTYWEAVN